jgi:hypothetical protein
MTEDKPKTINDLRRARGLPPLVKLGRKTRTTKEKKEKWYKGDPEFDHDLKKNEDGEGGVPANNIGSGHVAGYDPILSKKILRRKFAGEEVFVVDEERYHKARLGKKKYAKYEDYVGNDELGEAIRVYGRENYGRAIILQNENTGAMVYLRYGTIRAAKNEAADIDTLKQIVKTSNFQGERDAAQRQIDKMNKRQIKIHPTTGREYNFGKWASKAKGFKDKE